MEEEKKKKKTSTKKSTTTKKKTTTKPKTTTKKKVEKKEEIKEEKIEIKEEPIEVKEEVKEEPVEIKEEVKEEVEVKAEAIPVKEEKDTKQGPSIIIYLLVVLLTALLVLVIVYAYLELNTSNKKDSFIDLGIVEERVLYKDFEKIEKEEELYKLFPEKDFHGLDFDKYQYVVLEINYNPCSESNVKPTDYAIRDGILSVSVSYDASCGVCQTEYTDYLLELPKRLEFKSVQYIDKPLNNPNCDPFVAYKPILYFYPTKETKINVTLGNPDYLTTTYPRYNNGWNVTAYPDGTLKDKNGRSYYSLFWEGDNHPAKVHDEGFVVKGNEVLPFLESKLKALGLNDKEANEFIIYWLPKLEKNNYNYIYFETKEEINNYMPLNVNPTPDTIIRIQMDYKPLEEKINVKEQKINTPKRTGFTVVEWGGSIIKD